MGRMWLMHVCGRERAFHQRSNLDVGTVPRQKYGLTEPVPEAGNKLARTTGRAKYIKVYAMFTRKDRLIIAKIRNKILFYRI